VIIPRINEAQQLVALPEKPTEKVIDVE
jgi:hypothetical protein